jgi:hypothetical protein
MGERSMSWADLRELREALEISQNQFALQLKDAFPGLRIGKSSSALTRRKGRDLEPVPEAIARWALSLRPDDVRSAKWVAYCAVRDARRAAAASAPPPSMVDASAVGSPPAAAVAAAAAAPAAGDGAVAAIAVVPMPAVAGGAVPAVIGGAVAAVAAAPVPAVAVAPAPAVASVAQSLLSPMSAKGGPGMTAARFIATFVSKAGQLTRQHGSQLAWVGLLLITFAGAIRSFEAVLHTNAVLAQSNERVTRSLEVFATGHVAPGMSIKSLVVAGLKMPDKPDPSWLQATPDGRCIDPSTGDELRGYWVFRGICFGVSLKINPDKPCPKRSFDAPPEAPQWAKNRCFDPIKRPDVDPQAVEPKVEAQ